MLLSRERSLSGEPLRGFSGPCVKRFMQAEPNCVTGVTTRAQPGPGDLLARGTANPSRHGSASRHGIQAASARRVPDASRSWRALKQEARLRRTAPRVGNPSRPDTVPDPTGRGPASRSRKREASGERLERRLPEADRPAYLLCFSLKSTTHQLAEGSAMGSFSLAGSLTVIGSEQLVRRISSSPSILIFTQFPSFASP